ncbi:hypothetical protein V6Z88_004208 [Aspergillus fumigatus]|jgi:SAM-dependent methyltransferase|uniref:Methyltransferase n=2 Tax=Aspergillus fumigatus TaxID=746128 RepID=Q4WLP6_ASPFU|nr:conserved hypothetical protein [Aspergillus fumigatus Af293]EAL89118.1 conserved hypothetical protein [Aspergillus fumigatus Af293]EDP49845.1 conserved hypothetical protein [Aspergillus fumigatus A1163]KEY77578.1 hypothetical protein BA78_6927 [Aspergillus fumigatus]
MSDFTELNRQYFSKLASSYREEFRQGQELIFNEVQGRRAWISDTWNDTKSGKGHKIRMLEYACGPGAVSAALAPFVDHIVGIDVSEEMIKQFNINAQETGFADKMHGYHGDLLAEPVPDHLSGPEFFDFDLVAVSMALHHFDKPDMALQRLGERLKKDGMFLIIDLVLEDEHSSNSLQKAFPQASATVRTHGFTSDSMQKLFEEAGMGQNFDYKVIQEPIVFRKEGKEIRKTVFIARSQRS